MTTYRSTLEICEEIAANQCQIHALECVDRHLRDELRAKTGKEYEPFIEGMRALLAPKETAQ